MLAKKNRADKKDLVFLFKGGKFVSSNILSFRSISVKKNSIPRVSFLAPKNIAKLAVKRNLLRRRGYTALKKYIDQLPSGMIGAFTFKKYEENISILENEIKNLLTKIN